MRLLLAFIAVPLIEIALFIQVGGLIGLWPTLAIVLLTALAGSWLVRSQGRMALEALRGSLRGLRDPSEPLAHGAMILLSGALLLTPGFFTDAVGFALLVPAVRRAALRLVSRRVSVTRVVMGDPTGGPMGGPMGGSGRGARREPSAGREARPPRPPASGEVVEGEWTEIAPGARAGDDRADRPASGWTRR